MDEADRLYADLLTATELLSGPLEGARLDRHDGYAFMLFPELPLPSFNGIWAESDAAASVLEEAHGAVTSHGLPFGVLVRAGTAPAVEEAAGGLGLTEQLRLPAMAVTPDELVTPADDVEILRVETADGLAQSLDQVEMGRVGREAYQPELGVTLQPLRHDGLLEVGGIVQVEDKLLRPT